MWPEGGVEHTNRRAGGDTLVDPTPSEVRPRSARQWWPGDETKRGADDPPPIEVRNSR